MKTSLKLFIISFCVYLFLWLFLYQTKINETLVQSEDTIPSIFTPVALILDRTLYLDNYYQMMVTRYPHPDDKDQALGKTPFYLRKVEIHYISAFPIISPLLALPIYFAPVLSGMDLSWFNLALLAKITAAAIVSLSGVVLYKLLLEFLDQKKAVLVTALYLFATINFATVSQALWQHGALELFTLLSLYYLLKAEKSANLLSWSGFFMGIAVLSRPTAALPLLLISIYVYKKHSFAGIKRYLWPLIFSVAFFALYNGYFYQSVSNQGYSSQLLDWKTPPLLGFFGLWLSPSKGLLVYSPVFIFSVILAVRLLKSKAKEDTLFKYFFAIAILHTLIVGMWKHWYGGWSFGYRMASDIIPYLVLLLVPYLKSSLFNKTKKLFYFFIIWSIAVELLGMAFFDGTWHGTFDRGFRNQSWLWSIKNSEISYYIQRMITKLNLFL